MANGTALHEAAATHYAEAKDHRQVPLEWHPDEQNSLSSCYSMRRRNHRARTIKLKYRRSGWYMGLASRSPCAT